MIYLFIYVFIINVSSLLTLKYKNDFILISERVKIKNAVL
jgi:hypothetical protein